MLTADRLEKIIELETNLRAEYQSKLDTKSAEIESGLKKVAELQATIATQLQTITDLSAKASASLKLEQQNRELDNRSENMKEEVGTHIVEAYSSCQLPPEVEGARDTWSWDAEPGHILN